MYSILSINPATGKVIKEFEPFSQDQINTALIKADNAFKRWKELHISQRCELLTTLAQLLRENKQELGELITLEMGKVIKQSVAEIVKCADTIDYFANHSAEFTQPELIQTTADKAMIYYEPMGVVLAIKPWNFPFWQVLSSASHVIAAGNVILLKHSSYVSMCALKIEKLFLEAGFPEGVFQTLLIDGSRTSQLIENDIIKAVSFTGSDNIGKRVAEIAGKNMKKCVLELGGSDPFIVFKDADVDKAAKIATSTRCMNAGQTCIAPKRFLVAQEIVADFTNTFIKLIKKMKIGDPSNPMNDIGPLVREDQIIILEEQVHDALSKGAEVFYMGGKLVREGFFYAPVVLGNINMEMKVMKEETFGPIAPIISFEREEEAIKIANSTQYGLGASIWTEDIRKGEDFARKLETGMVAVNSFFSPEPTMPFGGIKFSGMGTEMSKHGLYEFVHIKSLKINQN